MTLLLASTIHLLTSQTPTVGGRNPARLSNHGKPLFVGIYWGNIVRRIASIHSITLISPSRPAISPERICSLAACLARRPVLQPVLHSLAGLGESYMFKQPVCSTTFQPPRPSAAVECTQGVAQPSPHNQLRFQWLSKHSRIPETMDLK